MTYPQAVQHVLDGGKVRRSDWPEDWELSGTPPLLNGKPYASDVMDWVSSWEALSGASILEAIKWVESKYGRKAKIPGCEWWIEEYSEGDVQVRDDSGWWGDNSRFKLKDIKSDKWILFEDD